MFIFDIHGSLPATGRMPERLAQSGARQLAILGNALDRGPRNALPGGYAPAEVTARLNSVVGRIIAVRDNRDSEVGQTLLRFPMTAPWQQMPSERYHLFLTHGHLYSPGSSPPLDAGDVPVYGHTHIPVAEGRGTIYLFDPSSMGIPKGGYSVSYGLLDQGCLQVLAFNDNQVVAKVAIYL